MKVFILLVGFVISVSLNAAVDPWNTYQWNRKNELAKNGKINTSPWFEWWYYKITIPENGKSYYFVYGVVNPWDTNKTMKGTRSYMGMGDFQQKLIAEGKYALQDFNASYKETFVEVNGNIATDKDFQGTIFDEAGRKFSWDVKIDKKWAHNAEGWMMGTGITDIEWYPAQASATCSGRVESAGEIITFTDAPCYQDRNWGSRFPDWWAWIVSNHFENSPNTALAIGGGKPGVLGRDTSYANVSIGYTHKGKVISFRPIDLQLIRTDITFGNWKVMAINRNYRIEIEATAPKESFMDLQFMTPTGELFHDYETLNGKVTVKLYKRVGLFFKPLPVETSNFAGIEFGSKDEYKSMLIDGPIDLLKR